MNKTPLKVPKGIRFINDWKDYNLDDYQFPHILNKVLTGCGFTEYCLSNPMNIILLSPRKMLLESKESQHPGEVFYARNEIENTIDFEKDIKFSKKYKSSSLLNNIQDFDKTEISSSKQEKDLIKQKLMAYKEKIKEYIFDCIKNNRPCKILVTYDSFRHVKEVLKKFGILERFYIVVDEFQSFLVDSHFKSSTELEVLFQLQDIQKVCFASATPMLDNYLDFLDEFKNLPYFELDWETEDPNRVTRPFLEVRFTKRGLNEELSKVIQPYLEKNFEKKRYLDSLGNPFEIESREATIFVNSVKSIARAIITNKLTISQCNVLCARTSDNDKVIRKAFNLVLEEFGYSKLSKDEKVIGSIPGKGKPHKMFTFCTRTVYLGADFYSTNSRTFIFSDSNIDCLAVDVSMDLEQILGRQRLDENPWKNSATLFVKTTNDTLSIKKFKNYIKDKINQTNNLLKAYSNNSGDSEELMSLAKEYQRMASTFNYKNNYVAVNHHSGKGLVPVFNNLVLVSEQRSFDIQQMDYKDRFTVFNALDKISEIYLLDKDIDSHVKIFNSLGIFEDKINYIHEIESYLSSYELNLFLNRISQKYKDYYIVFGFDKIKSLKYSEPAIIREWNKIMDNSQIKIKLRERIYQEFQEGQSYTRLFIKDKLKEIYQDLGYQETPKANQIEEYFEIKEIKLYVGEKRDNGFKLLNKKL